MLIANSCIFLLYIKLDGYHRTVFRYIVTNDLE